MLEEAGLVDVEKGFEGKRPRSWVSATTAGRKALDEEIAALSSLISRVNGDG